MLLIQTVFFSTYDTTTLISNGIYPEDFDIIPPNQNFYATVFDLNMIVKLPASHFTNFVGDLLVTEAGEIFPQGKLFVIHWDAVNTNFVTRRISFNWPDGVNHHFEHITFAPIDLPSK